MKRSRRLGFMSISSADPFFDYNPVFHQIIQSSVINHRNPPMYFQPAYISKSILLHFLQSYRKVVQ